MLSSKFSNESYAELPFNEWAKTNRNTNPELYHDDVNKIFQNKVALYGIPCPPIKSFTPMKWDDKNKKCIRIKNKTKKIINKSREKSKNKTIKKKI